MQKIKVIFEKTYIWEIILLQAIDFKDLSSRLNAALNIVDIKKKFYKTKVLGKYFYILDTLNYNIFFTENQRYARSSFL